MNGNQFDNLTRPSGASRRPLLVGLAASGLTGLFGPLALSDEVAAKKKKKKGSRRKSKVLPPAPWCPSARIYVECPWEDVCSDDPNFCCADAPSICCPESLTCGNWCCFPELPLCVNGECQGYPSTTFARVRRR